MQKLLIATNNQGKIREYQEILGPLPVSLTTLAEAGIKLDPEETGTTFEANALLKARAFAEHSDMLVLADDSGIEIDALDGEPGVYSARYGDTGKDEHVRRYQIVLEKIKNAPWEQRTGRFRCVVALAYKDQIIGTAEGTVEGFITRQPKGRGGFGYDPIFYYPEFEATLAEIPAEQKHSISHRGRAARAALPLIERFFSENTIAND